jgi:hypothetical protein
MERNGSDVRRGSREHAPPPALTASFVASSPRACRASKSQTALLLARTRPKIILLWRRDAWIWIQFSSTTPAIVVGPTLTNHTALAWQGKRRVVRRYHEIHPAFQKARHHVCDVSYSDQ